MSKQRLSASVDADLLGAAARAVTRGRVESVSAWVNDALRLKMEHERRLDALDAAVAAYEAEHGEITPEEMAAQRRADRQSARVVRGAPAVTAKARGGRRRGAA